MSKTTEHIYRTLRLNIISGELPPGMQMKEEEVSEKFKVSRTPVRSAFQKLIHDGLVVKGERRGIFVAEWTIADIQEVFRLRMLLEPHAASQAAYKAKLEEIERLGELANEMHSIFVRKEENSIMDIQRNNHQFHTAIIQASRSPRLQSMLTPLVKAPVVIGAFHVYDDAEIQRSIYHHRDIVTALSLRDPELAEELMRVHLHMSYISFMRSRSEQTSVRGS
ncbi:GntR family transcriptional regulator [Halomonas sp. ANAO-440]|uniref:GntR family transcriptional regulator n=1 Tax=Halomonas sp. ANAO-440 TaxID=2861360 RepID=UPI001CAA449A|nr:GntR family transcriptional regulator [Halomonas sp. ANAO-440]MBZ0331011.1 GntR family transcriptional regulator [Halomonas sp. ANAO-440]